MDQPRASATVPAREASSDEAVWAAVDLELARQESQLELIASENHTSREVMAAMGTVLTNKYAEGYPGRRYYGGCEHVDTVEDLARDARPGAVRRGRRTCAPTSSRTAGTQANIAALMTLCEPGDQVLAMSLDHGGHLSHGHPEELLGRLLPLLQLRRRARAASGSTWTRCARSHCEVRPKVIMAGASAYSRADRLRGLRRDRPRGRGAPAGRHGPHRRAGRRRRAPEPRPARRRRHHDHPQDPARPARRADRVPQGVDQGHQQRGLPRRPGRALHARHRRQGDRPARGARSPPSRDYARRVVENAAALADTLTERGLRIVSGGTDNHLMLVDVSSIGLSGKQAEDLLHAVDLTATRT